MPFDYYERLTRRQQATYRRSDAVGSLAVPEAHALAPHVRAMAEALQADDRRALGRAVGAFVDGLMRALRAPPVQTEVLARRPSSAEAELHGLYTREDDGAARIQVWMRTAANARPVAHRTFVRTLLHECCHHLDFELLQLEDTFHTRGFFQRESSLVRQLLPGAPARPPREPRAPSDVVAPRRRGRTPGPGAPGQLELFPGPKK